MHGEIMYDGVGKTKMGLLWMKVIAMKSCQNQAVRNRVNKTGSWV